MTSWLQESYFHCMICDSKDTYIYISSYVILDSTSEVHFICSLLCVRVTGSGITRVNLRYLHNSNVFTNYELSVLTVSYFKLYIYHLLFSGFIYIVHSTTCCGACSDIIYYSLLISYIAFCIRKIRLWTVNIMLYATTRFRC